MSTSTFSGIKACVFDAYGTLFDVNSAVAKHKDAVGPNYGEISVGWRTRQLQYTWLRSLMRQHVDFWQVTGDALKVTLQEHHRYDETLYQDLMQAYTELSAFGEVPDVLALLKHAGFSTAILTNGSPAMISSAVDHAGINHSIDYQLSVETVGIFKPDRRVYQLAVDTLNLQPSEIAFMSSNAWDAAGAADFGFVVAWVNRYSQPSEALPGVPAAELSDLTGLPGLLGVC